MRFTFLILAAVVLGCAAPPDEPAAAAAALDEIGRAFHRMDLDESLWLKLKYGVEVTSLPEVSPEHAESRSAAARALLGRLAEVDAAALDHARRVTLEALRWDLGMVAEEARHYWLFFPVTPYSFNWYGVHDLFQSLGAGTEADAARYLDLAGQYAAFVAALEAKLAGQMERGIVMPRAEIDLVAPTWRALPASPQTVFPLLEGAPGSAPESFRDDLAEIVDAEVAPAWESLAAFLGGPYREAAPEAAGTGQYPGGREYYAYLVRLYATLDATPEEIHQLGLERLAATTARMDAIRRQLGFAGTRAEFHARLEADPRFFAETPEEVEERYRAYVEAIEPAVDAWFERRPAAPYRVARLAPELEPAMTYGYYQEPRASDPRGTYFYNGSSLDERSLIGAASLIYHELVPGHHFQVALTNENEALPDYRRDSWHAAFTEGWAEYSSMLAEEMGMYADPYELYGRLADECFFYTRLVVDTGMNHFGWPRERAIEFMRANTLASETEIATETLRYAVDMPGQALAYALGALEIHGLRERARAALGERFDVRRFHSAVLGHGSLPLAVLEKHVEWFIEESRGAN